MSVDLKEIVTLETTKGNIEIELNRSKAPIAVENFVKYVNDGFFVAVSSIASFPDS